MTTVIHGIPEIDSIFQGLQAAIGQADYQDELQQIQKEVTAGEVQAFQGQHDPEGIPWEPLKPATAVRKKQSQILVETGSLMEFLVSLGSSGNINTTDSRKMLFGTDVEYATFLDSGTRTMPARPLVGISEETLETLVNQAVNKTVTRLKG